MQFFKIVCFTAFFAIKAIFPGFANEIFAPGTQEKCRGISSELKRIENQLQKDFPVEDQEIIDYLKTNQKEYFFHTNDGLFYAEIKPKTVGIERLFWRTLGQITPLFSFFNQSEKYIIFQNNEMKNGIETDWYRLLHISPSHPFKNSDFVEVYGFQSDSENGLDFGQTVKHVTATNFEKNGSFKILFSVEVSDYRNKTESEEKYEFQFLNGKIIELKRNKD